MRGSSYLKDKKEDSGARHGNAAGGGGPRRNGAHLPHRTTSAVNPALSRPLHVHHAGMVLTHNILKTTCPSLLTYDLCNDELLDLCYIAHRLDCDTAPAPMIMHNIRLNTCTTTTPDSGVTIDI